MAALNIISWIRSLQLRRCVCARTCVHAHWGMYYYLSVCVWQSEAGIFNSLHFLCDSELTALPSLTTTVINSFQIVQTFLPLKYSVFRWWYWCDSKATFGSFDVQQCLPISPELSKWSKVIIRRQRILGKLKAAQWCLLASRDLCLALFGGEQGLYLGGVL